ncbi:hypothetical protein NKH77_04850 [Streptomyces sp. M19]
MLLHGGSEHGVGSPPLLNLPALRMRPFRAAVRREPGGERLLVASVRYRVRAGTDRARTPRATPSGPWRSWPDAPGPAGGAPRALDGRPGGARRRRPSLGARSGGARPVVPAGRARGPAGGP